MDHTWKNKMLVLIFSLTFLVYGNSIKNGYAFDDNYVTVTTPNHPNNPRIAQGIKIIPELFKSYYVEIGEQRFEYRPMVLATFAIEYEFFGSNAHISHFINILLYAITCCVLFLTLSILLKNYSVVVPLLVTLLFLAHPIHTEVVTNIKSRDELLAFLLGMLSLYFILKSETKHTVLYLFLATLCFFMASFCKATYILFLALIPVTLFFFTSIPLKKIISVFALLVLAFVSFKLLHHFLLDAPSKAREFAFFENPLFYEENYFRRIAVGFYTIGYYFRLFMFPYPLCCYYGYSIIPMAGWSSPFVIFSVILHTTMLVYVIKKIKQKDLLSYGIIVYFLGILPFANVISIVVGIVGERFVYFSSFGFCIMITFLLLKLFKMNEHKESTAFKIQNVKFAFKACIVIIFITLSAFTIARNNQWKDEITLLRHDVKQFPNSCNLHYITGNKIYPQIFTTPNGAKRDLLIQEATFHYKAAVALMTEGVEKYPKDFTTLNNIGTIYVNIFNDPVSAQPFFKRALHVKPDNTVAQYNFAYCYEKRNLHDSAITCYEKLVSKNTPCIPVYLQLRDLYFNKNQFSKTISCDKKTILLNPTIAKYYINLGNAYLANKDTLNGIDQFIVAVRLEPKNTDLKKQIISFLNSSGHPEKIKKLEK